MTFSLTLNSGMILSLVLHLGKSAMSNIHQGLVLCCSCVSEKVGINKKWYSHVKYRIGI
jgi:hypothetical protein